MSVSYGSVNTSGYVPDTPDQFRGSTNFSAVAPETIRRHLDSRWRSRFLSREALSDLSSSRVIQQLDFREASCSSRSASLGNEMSTEGEREALHKRQEEILANPELAKGLRIAACNRVLGMPEVRTLVEEQVRLLAGDPEVMRRLEAQDDDTKPTADTFEMPWVDDVPTTKETDLDDVEARTRKAFDRFGEKSLL